VGAAILALRYLSELDLKAPAVGYRPHRTIHLAGQTGIDADGKVAESFRAQAVQGPDELKAIRVGSLRARVGHGYQLLRRQDQAGKASTGDGTGDSTNRIDRR
jgi:hypothetical protein